MRVVVRRCSVLADARLARARVVTDAVVRSVRVGASPRDVLEKGRDWRATAGTAGKVLVVSALLPLVGYAVAGTAGGAVGLMTATSLWGAYAWDSIRPRDVVGG